MKTLIYNYNSLILSYAFESVATRAGYLFADRCILATKKAFTIAMIKKPHQVRRRLKIGLLERAYPDGETKKLLDQIKNIYHIENTQKHKTKKQLVAAKKTDKILDDLFQTLLDEKQEVLRANGILDLEQLEETNVFDFFVPGYETEYNGKLIPPVSPADFLQLKMNFEDMSAALFCLPTEFMNADFQAIMHEMLQDIPAQDYYLETCFSLPNINLLSAPELKALRKQLLPHGTSFRTACDEWIGLCYHNAEKEQRQSCFRNRVMPAVPEWQSRIGNNELLRSLSGLKNFDVAIEVLMGEIPVNILWHFYRHYKTIDDETWQELQQKGLPACANWPVMIVHAKNTIAATAKKLETETEPVSVKKSIPVD